MNDKVFTKPITKQLEFGKGVEIQNSVVVKIGSREVTLKVVFASKSLKK
ncbi:MAG: hypothetical protein U9Q40_00300 [Campylobacterota bacterium]|nr:hypothetical protein [Campylobacterota bacterium]